MTAERTSFLKRKQTGHAAFFRGHLYEWVAAIWLILKGYRLLGFRVKTKAGEIDLLALKADCLILVEVKQRSDLLTALSALGHDQIARIARAGRLLQKSRPDLRPYGMRLDLIVFCPRALPVHIQAHVPELGQV